MKIKFLALAMIAMLFTACKPDPQPEGGEGSGTNNGNAEGSYIAISIAADNMDRGFDDGTETFEDGLADENVVKSVNVFFFRNGNSFIINEAIGKNFQEFVFNKETQKDNIEEISNSVLVINKHQGELPNQMVVVLNWTPNEDTYTLAELQAALTNHINNIDGTNYFVMSNAVYKDAAGDVYATPLAITDFQETATDARNNPVQVYVERVAAKVRVTTNGDIDDDQDPANDGHTFALRNAEGGEYKVKVGGFDTPVQVYAKITGWELYNDYQESYLLKNIKDLPAYNDEFNGFWWNSPSNHRSYWANSRTLVLNETLNYNSITEYPNQKYCGENTKSPLNGDGVNKTLRTQVVLKAELQANGQPIEIARWHGNDYIEKENLIIAVTNTLVNTYYTRTEDANSTTEKPVYIYNPITTNDLQTVVGYTALGEKEYVVYVQLKDDTKTWYKRNGSAFEEISYTDLNDELKGIIGEALLYEGGKTYYFTDIKHLGNTYGVVRNHIYDININSITGLGTPVVSGNPEIVTPEVPKDNATYVAAQINILSWRLITNDVDL